MSFWKDGNLDPVRKHRFKFQFNGVEKGKSDWFWAQSVTKPSYDINSNEYQLTNHKFKYPGILLWQDVTVTIVDVGAKASSLMGYVNQIGYNIPTESSTGIEKSQKTSQCIIKQYNSAGDTIETWTLYNSIIKTISFGDLSYNDDGLVEIQLTIMYDWASLSGDSGTVKSGGLTNNNNT
tara:strand:- start:153 stop:689 length:537 start_codon:yes stop_codon:yes gene_type:complete